MGNISYKDVAHPEGCITGYIPSLKNESDWIMLKQQSLHYVMRYFRSFIEQLSAHCQMKVQSLIVATSKKVG